MTPPLELVQEWVAEIYSDPTIHVHPIPIHPIIRLVELASQYGADQELKACCEWLESEPDPGHVDLLRSCATALRAVRRPKPPSLKKQACDALDAYVYGEAFHYHSANSTMAPTPTPTELARYSNEQLAALYVFYMNHPMWPDMAPIIQEAQARDISLDELEGIAETTLRHR